MDFNNSLKLPYAGIIRIRLSGRDNLHPSQPVISSRRSLLVMQTPL